MSTTGSPAGAPFRGRMALVITVAAAVALRITASALRGDYLGFDESMYILLGRNLLSGQGYVLNGLPNATFPFGVSLLAGVGDALFGPRWALSLPSAVLGGLAVVPLYLLALRMASRTTALTSAILYAGFPALLFFSPFVSYGRRLYEGSEQIYIFLTLAMAYFAYSALVEKRLRDFVLAGLFAGAAFEIRQEAAALCALLTLWMCLAAVWQRNWRCLAKALALPAAALMLALPFVLHVRNVTGAVGPGVRLAGSLPMRDAFMPVVEKNDWTSALDYLLALSKDGAELEQPYYGVSPWHRERLRLAGTGVAAMLADLRPGYVLEAVRLFVEKAVPDKLIPLLLVGIAALFLGPRRWTNAAFLFVMALPAAFLAMALFPLARFSVYLAPYVVLLLACGICLVFDVAGMALKRFAPHAPAAAFAVAAVLSAYGSWDSLSAQKKYRANHKNYERVVEELQKKAAQWLFVNTGSGAPVMADSPQACVLARREWLALPRDTDLRVMEYARAKKAAVVIRTAGKPGDRPRLMESALVAIFSDYTAERRVSLHVYDVARFGSRATGLGGFNKFILVTVDTLRADHLGCYGYSRKTSPAIDALAGESTKYTRAFSACSYTGPSVTSILTSRYPGLNDSNFANGYPVPPVPVATLAKVFDQANFDTAALVGNSVFRKTAGLAEGFQLYDATFDSSELNRKNVERAASSLAPAAISWLERHADKPFFMWVHFQDPHGPYTPPEPYSSMFDWRTDNPTVLPILQDSSGYRGLPAYQSLAGHSELEFYLSQYDGEIAFADEWIGRLLARVRELGIWDETVIVFSADHGEAFGENEFYCAHGHWVGPELTRVPLVVRVPGVAAGIVETPVSLVDVAPTLVDLAALDVPATFMGRSLFRSAGNPARDKGFIIETPYAIASCDGRLMYTWGRALPNHSRPENNKATSPEAFDFDGAPTGLYDVASDLSWTTDIQQRDGVTAARLRQTCEEHIAASVEFCGRIPEVRLDEDSRKALEALGYIAR